MRIEQLMSQPAITCRPNDTLNTAAQLMWEHDCGAVPVVGAEGKLVGIITDRDVCMAACRLPSTPSRRHPGAAAGQPVR